MSKEVPYFIKIHGCINCGSSIALKEKTGHEYGFNHELMARCVIGNCFDYGHTLLEPYYDPEEIAKFANKIGTSEAKENAKKVCLNLDSQYGKFYQKEGISIRTILEKLEP